MRAVIWNVSRLSMLFRCVLRVIHQVVVLVSSWLQISENEKKSHLYLYWIEYLDFVRLWM